jgi:tRNA pseudouridine38-40 synthase
MDEAARSPFRSRFEWWLQKPLDASLLARAAAEILGEHSFRAFAVQGTAPEDDLHICDVREAEWQATDTGFVFRINANRFLHHMVRFLVGTMADVACGKRHPETVRQLLLAADNREVSPPAPPHALFLEGVEYPADLYCADG